MDTSRIEARNELQDEVRDTAQGLSERVNTGCINGSGRPRTPLGQR